MASSDFEVIIIGAGKYPCNEFALQSCSNPQSEGSTGLLLAQGLKLVGTKTLSVDVLNNICAAKHQSNSVRTRGPGYLPDATSRMGYDSSLVS